VPGLLPLTTFDEGVIINATGGLLLDHDPPAVALNKVVVAPWHTADVPVILVDIAFTDTIAVLVQPLTAVAIMGAVPLLIPDTTPVPLITVATGILAELQVTPGVAVLNVVDAPMHTDSEPVKATGCGITVATTVARQLVGRV
jgi:hypothetical protein